MLQFLAGWLARDPAGLAASWKSSPATPPTAPPSYAPTWTALSSFSAAATASLCPGSRRHEPAQAPGQPRILRALPASTSFVLALRAAGAPR